MALDYLNRYLERIQRRLAANAFLSGLAIAASLALGLTLLLVTIHYRLDVAESNWNYSRALLFLSLAGAVVFGIVLPLLVLNKRRAAQRVEQVAPELDQRLMTVLEDPNRDNPMLGLVAEQAWEQARTVEPSQVVSNTRLAGFAGTALVSSGVLLWLILAAPGWLGQGSALLWGGVPKAGSAFDRSLKVEPGSTKVRRKASQKVIAEVRGFAPAQVKIFARFVPAAPFEEVPMLNMPDAPGQYEFLFAGLDSDVDYYVVAGSLKSPEFKLTVVDLPKVSKYRATYRFPSWSGMPDQLEDPAGDLRAVTGTQAYLEFLTDKPLDKAVIVMEGGAQVPVQSASPEKHLVTLPISKDSSFHFAMVEDGKPIRLTDDYFIEALKEGPPEVSFERPGRSLKVSPIEEVLLEIKATDDFGLTSLSLHYSVNGGEEKVVPLPVARGSKLAKGRHLLALEEFNLQPGDNVLFYAKARDAKAEATTAPFFLEAQPYEREFSQSQQSGGGMGGQGEQEGDIVERQKQIISATFYEQRSQKSSAEVKEIGKFLGETQEKLRAQTQTFVQRIRARQLTGQNETIANIAKELEQAATYMAPAAADLRGLKFKDALPNEQKALQHLQRAEALRKEVEVAMQQGGGGGGGAQRDLESLLDLELDTEKNQYETGQQLSAEQQQREVDEALRKLEELARRQQELANQAQRNQQTSEQRWQQEMLRREAERLQEELNRLQQNQQQQAQSRQQQGQQGQQGQSGQQGQQGQAGQQSAQNRQQNRLNRDPRLDRAMENLRNATEDMRRATSQQQQGQSGQGEARRAAERLEEARKMLGQMEQQGKQQQINELARRAEQLAAQQKDFERKLREAYGGEAGQSGQQQGQQGAPKGANRDPRVARELGAEKQQMFEDYQRLEKDIQDASRQMRSNQRSASAKLQEGLGEAQKDDINLKLKMLSDYIRQGYGQYMVGREREVTRSLESLRDKVLEAEKMVAGAGSKSDPTEKALQQIEQLRQQIAALTEQQQQGQNGQQGQGQQGQQQGQQGQQAQGGGQQRGQGRQQGQGSRGGEQQAQGMQQGQGQDGSSSEMRGREGDSSPFRDRGQMNTGSARPREFNGMQPSADAMRAIERNYQQSLRDLQELRNRKRADSEGGSMSAADQAELQKMLQEMAALDPSRFRNNPALLEQMRTRMLPLLEQLELKLRRDLDGSVGQSDARSATVDRVPTGYADQVAEYFRRLSQGSQKKN